MGERISLDQVGDILHTLAPRASEAKVGDLLLKYEFGSRHGDPYVKLLRVTKVGRKWRYFEYLGRGSGRYSLIESGSEDGLCYTDGGNFSQSRRQVLGSLDWEDRSLRKWVDETLIAANIRFELGRNPSWEKRLALARFLAESDLWDTPDPATVSA